MRPLPVLALILLFGALSLAASGASETTPEPAPGVDVTPPSKGPLTGRDIYECVLANRFDSYVQKSKLISGDRGDATQESRLRMTWRSFRDEEKKAVKGVLSKTIVKYTDPFDLRFSGYLIANNESRANDQFVYLNATRKVRRVNLRREAVFGTDFTFEDIVPREIEDGDYERLADAEVEGMPVYAVEVTPKPHTKSEYSRFLIHVDKTTCVPLLTRYWDDRDLEVKKLTVPSTSVETVDGIYWPMKLTMQNLQLETFTTLEVEELEPNIELSRRDFDLRKLEAH